MLARHIHDAMTELNKSGMGQRLCEEVSLIVCGSHERNHNAAVFYTLSNKEMPASDVLHPAEVLGVVGYVNGALVVTFNFDRCEATSAKLF